MLRLLFALCLLPHVAMAANEGGDGWLIGVRSGHPGSLRFHLDDDVVLSLGATLSAPDYWCEHDTSSTPDELACWTTDSDGGGTNIKWLSVPDGTDDPVFSGKLSIGAGTVVSSPADGDLLITESTGTQGAYLNTQTSNRLTLTNQAGGNLEVVANILQGNSGLETYGSSTYVMNQQTGGDFTVRTAGNSGTNGPTGDALVTSGDQTNSGDYASGDTIVRSGATTTDGNTGDVIIYPGQAGAGAADSGSVLIGANGDATGKALTIDGATGAVLPNVVVGTDALAEPFACTASVAGATVYVDDTDDSSPPVRCVCFATGDDGAGTPTMDWRDAGDPVGTACSAF
jgi:hypothetical protein